MGAKNNSVTGLDKNTAGALSYVLGPVSGVVFLVLEKDAYVRFHAMQSIVFSVGVWLLMFLLGATLFLAVLVGPLVVFAFVMYLLLIYKAWQGEEWELPLVGGLARKLVKKF